MSVSLSLQARQWRRHEERMQAVSGQVVNPIIHFEDPPFSRVPIDMRRFIAWFNETPPGGKQEIKQMVVRSAAHFYFESIHPFEDGHGKFRGTALLSLSRIMEAHRKKYYEAPQTRQQSNDITSWVIWFVNMALDAQAYNLFFHLKDEWNERQLKVIARMVT